MAKLCWCATARQKSCMRWKCWKSQLSAKKIKLSTLRPKDGSLNELNTRLWSGWNMPFPIRRSCTLYWITAMAANFSSIWRTWKGLKKTPPGSMQARSYLHSKRSTNTKSSIESKYIIIDRLFWYIISIQSEARKYSDRLGGLRSINGFRAVEGGYVR